MAILKQGTNTILNKWTILVGAFLLIYLNGGFRIITNNPSILIFAILGMIIVYAMNRR